MHRSVLECFSMFLSISVCCGVFLSVLRSVLVCVLRSVAVCFLGVF